MLVENPTLVTTLGTTVVYSVSLVEQPTLVEFNSTRVVQAVFVEVTRFVKYAWLVDV